LSNSDTTLNGYRWILTRYTVENILTRRGRELNTTGYRLAIEYSKIQLVVFSMDEESTIELNTSYKLESAE
jgi:hypothetical protein